MSDSGPVIAAASIQATTKSIQTNINLATLPPGFMSPLLKCGKQSTQRLETFFQRIRIHGQLQSDRIKRAFLIASARSFYHFVFKNLNYCCLIKI